MHVCADGTCSVSSTRDPTTLVVDTLQVPSATCTAPVRRWHCMCSLCAPVHVAWGDSDSVDLPCSTQVLEAMFFSPSLSPLLCYHVLQFASCQMTTWCCPQPSPALAAAIARQARLTASQGMQSCMCPVAASCASAPSRATMTPHCTLMNPGHSNQRGKGGSRGVSDIELHMGGR